MSYVKGSVMYIDVFSKCKCAVNRCAADLLFPLLIYDMAQMTECVASSISRWHGCKAEYYLLSCSTHSDLRWRVGRRRGPGVYFSEAATNKLLPQA